MMKPIHAGARSSFRLVTILSYVTIIGIPFGLWLRARAKRAHVAIGDTELVARGVFKTTRVALADVERVGLMRVEVNAPGIGGHYGRKKVGGDVAVHLCLRTRAGKTRSFMVSMYEDHDAIVGEVSRRCGAPVEDVTMGLGGPKWDQSRPSPSK
jgi:hypothetical protein